MTKDFARSNFMILCIGSSIICLYPVVFFPKGEIELLINQNHYPILDLFFKYITHLGDGVFLGILLISLLFIRYSAAILTAFSIILQAVFVSIFKRWIFKGLERPLAFFGDNVDLYLVDGVDVHSSNTFPSGHAATGFALFALVFVLVNNNRQIVSLVLFLLAFFVGFSRVYLLQHFIVDVYFGAVFGVLSVLLGLYFAESIFSGSQWERLTRNSWRTTFKKRS
ncbi:MAG: phosphatase PAP2 family protein [Cytophagales bacterium]|nr:phosphatase PAP2 family protein [Cytophagales bacterium]